MSFVACSFMIFLSVIDSQPHTWYTPLNQYQPRGEHQLYNQFRQQDHFRQESLEELETAVKRAVDNSEVADSLYGRMQNFTLDKPLEIAYFGVVETLLAKHSFNPYKKLRFAKQGIKTLDKAVYLSPGNAKIRLLRFNIQNQIPGVLGLSKSLDKDKQFLIRYLLRANGTSVAKEERVEIACVLLRSGRCTPEEKKKIKGTDE